MGSIFKPPKIPAPPPLEMPKVEDVPEADDESYSSKKNKT